MICREWPTTPTRLDALSSDRESGRRARLVVYVTPHGWRPRLQVASGTQELATRAVTHA
jgi:hypothetical protein